MKILHVTPTYLPAVRYGGPIYSVHGLCRALVRGGHDVHVFTTSVDGPFNSPVPLMSPQTLDGVKIQYFSSSFLRRIYYSPSMKKAIRETMRNFDIIHNHSVFQWPTWESARCAARLSIPYVVSPKGMLVLDLIRRKSVLKKSVWIRFIEKNNLERASVVHLTSQIERSELLKFGFRLARLVVVPNGVDSPEEGVEPLSGLSAPVQEAMASGLPYVLFLGRLNWKKGLEKLVEAVKFFPDGVRLVIAGNDEDRYRSKIENIIRREGLSDRVVFTGPVYKNDKFTLLKNARCFALPSYSENFGNAAVEAMLCGCPVILTPEVGISNLVRESAGGILTDGSAEDLGRAVRAIFADENASRQMGERARAAAKEAYSWDVVSDQMARLYREIIDGKGGVT